jgi:hypothetical protein
MPISAGEDAERDRVAHEFEPDLFLGDLADRDQIPGDVVTLDVLG